MWWTSDGERILKGAEATLFQEALGVLVDYVQQDEEGTIWQFGVPPFDTLQYGQKLAVLAQVGTGLLRENEPSPKLTAVLEGAVSACNPASFGMMTGRTPRPTWMPIRRRAGE